MQDVETFVTSIISLLPNIAVAIWMLYQQGRTIDSLLDNQTKLIDRLLNYIDSDKAEARRMVAQAAPAHKTHSRRPLDATTGNDNG